MRNYKTICDLCKEDIDEVYYLIRTYSPIPKNKWWVKVFYPAIGNTKELDVCYKCIDKIINAVKGVANAK